MNQPRDANSRIGPRPGTDGAPLGPAVFIAGPTATGKTDLALALAQRLPVSVISVDSAMIYRHMDIGTAKPDATVRARVPHALIDILDPAESYSAARFRHDALGHMRAAWDAGRIPLLVGGTLLYYRALQHGLSTLPPSDPEVRRRLEDRLAARGLADLHGWLSSVDPQAGQRIHPNDPQRILRALEVFLISGTPMTELYRRDRDEPLRIDMLKVILDPGDRAWLHRRIEQRFRHMLEAGFEVEVRALMARDDLDLSRPSMRAVGYRQMWRYLSGDCSRAEMIAGGIAATRQYARRQLTWLRGESDGRWFDSRNSGAAFGAIVDWAEGCRSGG